MVEYKTQGRIDWSKALKDAPNYKPRSKGPTGHQIQETDRPLDILDAWTVVEALSPRSYEEPKDFAPSPQDHVHYWDGLEPWEMDQSLPKGKTAYYQIYLGSVALNPACEILLKKYHDPRVDKPRLKGRATLGVITVDEKGVPADIKNLLLSSFGWAFGRALMGELDSLRHWDFAEELLIEELKKILFQTDEEGTTKPLNMATISAAHSWLVETCEVPVELVQAPNFFIKMVRKIDSPEPEPELFNSFFLQDLQKARKLLVDSNAGEALKRYLQIDGSPSQKYLNKDRSLLINGLQPKFFPSGRWPVEGLYPLVLMQQFAVNMAKQELNKQGVFSVNGPPGTGKTTLLKDVIAHVIIERAKALAAFDLPKDAFEEKGKFPAYPQAVPLYELHSSLKGFEIVVACSNNGAAENLSKELPREDQIDHQTKPPQFFKTASDALVGDEIDTWGLIAAAFGKKENINRYRDNVWKHKETGLKSYLKESGNYPIRITKKDPETGEEYEDIPLIAKNEDPPEDWRDAQARWKKARIQFQEALAKAKRDQEIASKAFIQTSEFRRLSKEKALIAEKLGTVRQQYNSADTQLQNSAVLYQSAQKEAHIADEHTRLVNAAKPGWFSRFFKTRRWISWEKERADLLKRLSHVQHKLRTIESTYLRDVGIERDAAKALHSCQEELERLDEKTRAAQATLEEAKPIVGDHLILDDHYELPRDKQHKKSPTFTAEAHKYRDEVFRSALRLHKAFIDAAAIQFGQSLTAFFNYHDGEPMPEKLGHLLPDLWSIFFMVTPVISSTFASFGRMFRDMPPESIGWLLVDEAGQSTPQAAVGALMRSKRAMVVGDPLQLEPVVNLPYELVDTLSRHFRVEPTHWMAPSTSVQGLSDKATTYCSQIGDTQVGVPLLVHRRCDHPMFDMSNAISYENQMVFAASGTSETSGWLNVVGTDKDKWCPEEGEAAIQLVKECLQSEGAETEIFVISPFRNVVAGLERRFWQERSFFQSFGIDLKNWLEDKVGTVHTFQGKEAKAVVLVLGAQGSKRTGARSWVTGQPNLLNVAVSRAKKTLYVIGNHKEWATSGVMTEISERLPILHEQVAQLEDA